MKSTKWKLANGTQIYLAPGKHHELLIAIIEKFSPRFTPGAAVLYLGDVLNRAIIHEKDRLEQLGMPITAQDRLPDIIFYDEVRNLLFLVEAGISHISITHQRRRELETLLEGSGTTRVYVSAFLYLADYGRNASHIALGIPRLDSRDAGSYDPLQWRPVPGCPRVRKGLRLICDLS